MKILLTGATGKVGTHFLRRFLEDEKFSEATVKALCHNRLLEETSRLEIIRGSIADRNLVAEAINGVTHVLHLATCKRLPKK